MPLDHPKLLAEAVLEQNPVAFLVVNKHGQVIFANNAAVELAWKDLHRTTIDLPSVREIWGNAQDFEGRTIPVKEWPISLALRGIKTLARDLRMVRPDGGHYDISMTAAPLRTEEGIIGAIASFIDITERRQTEQRLTTINEQLQELATERARAIHLMHLISLSANNLTDIQGIFQITLTEICNHQRWPVGFAYIVQAPGRLHDISAWFSSNAERYETLRRVTASIDFSSKESAIGEVLRKGTTIFIADLESEEHFLRKDAVREACLKSYLAVPILVHKQPAAILEFFHTEPIKPQDSVLEVIDVIAAHLGQIIEQQRTEKKLQALFDSAPDAQIVTDTLGKIVMANRQTEKLFGYREDLLIGQLVDILVPPEHRTEHI
jgi:PAS domain-containing protein